MLVVVQLSVGLLLGSLFLRDVVPAFLSMTGVDAEPQMTAGLMEISRISAVVAAIVALLGQAGAFLHLGRPRYAFRAVLGWRTSWMSREILVLGAYTGLIAVHATSGWMAPLALDRGVTEGVLAFAVDGVAIAACIAGLLGLFASVMVYVDTHRAFWSMSRSALRFFGTAFVLGPMGLLLCMLAWRFAAPESVSASFEACRGVAVALCGFVMVATLSKLSGEGRALAPLRDDQTSTLKRSALLLVGPLRGVLDARRLLGVLGGVVIPFTMLGVFSTLGFASAASASAAAALAFASIGFGLSLMGEFLERHLFFRAEASPAMPGIG